MNFITFVLGAFGNKEKFAIAKQANWGKLVLAVGFVFLMVSIAQGIFMYTQVSRIFSTSLPAIISQWPENAVLEFKEGVLYTVPTSTVLAFTLNQDENNFSIMVNPDINRAEVQLNAGQNATLARDGFVLQSGGVTESVEYPKYELTLTRDGVVRFFNEFQSFGNSLLFVTTIFLFLIHIAAGLLTWIFLLFVVRLYSRVFLPLVSFVEASRVGFYLLIPFSVFQVLTFFVFGSQIFFISIIATLLCLHYGYRHRV